MTRHRSNQVRVAALAAVLICAHGPSTARSQPQERIARLVKQLGDADYRQRAEATEALEQLGGRAREPLIRVAASSEPEVALRAEALLARLRRNALWGGHAVTLPARGTPVELLKVAARQAGAGLSVPAAIRQSNPSPIAVSNREQDFWPAVDGICRTAGLRLSPHGDPRQRGFVLVRQVDLAYPVAYAGPIRAELTTARRSLTELLHYDTRESQIQETFQIAMQLMWEDRLRLAAYQEVPAVTRAVTDTGVELHATGNRSRQWNVVSRRSQQLSTKIQLTPPPTAAEKLTLLELGWNMVALAEMAELVVPSPAPGSRHFQDDLMLSIEEIAVQSGRRVRVAVLLRRDLLPVEPREVQIHECRLSLLDPEGKPLAEQTHTGSLRKDGIRLVATFRGGDDDRPFTLKLRYPRMRDRREVRIVFRDVPLPHAQPQ